MSCKRKIKTKEVSPSFQRKCSYVMVYKTVNSKDPSELCIYCLSEIKNDVNAHASECSALTDEQLCQFKSVTIIDPSNKNILGQIFDCIVCNIKYERPIGSICPNKNVGISCVKKQCQTTGCIHFASSSVYKVSKLSKQCSFEENTCIICKEKLSNIAIENAKDFTIFCREQNEEQTRSAKSILLEQAKITDLNEDIETVEDG